VRTGAQNTPVLAELILTVRDDAGRLVPNLTADAFQIEEGGTPQEIIRFSEDTQQPVSIGLLIDSRASVRFTSAMMAGEGIVPFIGALRTLVRSFGMNDDEFAIMTFGNSFEVRNRARGVDDADKALQLLYPQDLRYRTSFSPQVTLVNAIERALTEVQRSSYRHRALIVATHGEDIIRQNLPTFGNGEIPIYVIGFAGLNVHLQSVPVAPLQHEKDVRTGAVVTENSLSRLAESTGGRAELFLSNPERVIDRLIAFAKEVGAELRGQYRLSYYRTLPAPAVIRVRAGSLHVRFHRLASNLAAPRQD
jgi:VWFA-related protein